ncbi:MAG: 16S rRNA (guanine(966)-N(2))-methyltransferase RsmD [Nitrospirota bacterium]
MRISGGFAKGRRTSWERLPEENTSGGRLRPTSSKVREALFDILRNILQGSRFVDLYAGTGTVGLEALSRGAGSVVFVEPDGVRTAMIHKSIEALGFSGNAIVSKMYAEKFLQTASRERLGFDIFFLDPPYQSEEIGKVLPLIGSIGILNNEGIVIAEHFFKKPVPSIAGSLILAKQYRYGDTVLTLYREEPG